MENCIGYGHNDRDPTVNSKQMIIVVNKYFLTKLV